MKGVMMAAMIVLMVHSWLPSLSAVKPLTPFRRVQVRRETVEKAPLMEVVPFDQESLQTLRCSRMCDDKPWCNLWCLDPSHKQCYYSETIVMPDYNETMMSDVLTCYTRRPKDLATGTVINGTDTNDIYRIKENLVDGIFSMESTFTCYKPKISDYPWFMIDFGTPVMFRLVKIVIQNVGHVRHYLIFQEIEVRFGMSALDNPGNFTSYNIFGRFAGPAPESSPEIVFEVSKPVKARFLSVQKMEVNSHFFVCHVEVY